MQTLPLSSLALVALACLVANVLGGVNYTPEIKMPQMMPDSRRLPGGSLAPPPPQSGYNAPPPDKKGFTTHEVKCNTTNGEFTMRVDESLSPKGVERFLELVKSDFFTEQFIYRVEKDFTIQFGISGDPALTAKWEALPLKDEPRKADFQPGTISFAGRGPNTRSCHMFIGAGAQVRGLGAAPHEVPIGMIVENPKWIYDVVDSFQATGYSSSELMGLQSTFVAQGNAALVGKYMGLDRIHKCQLANFEYKPLGQYVNWMKADEDIPRGAVGEIVGPAGLSLTKLRVKFPSGVYKLATKSLVKAKGHGEL